MKHVGFIGGSSIVELGSPSEMEDFFSFFFNNLKENKNHAILERLYKKYVRLEELDEIKQITQELKDSLAPDIKDKYSKYISGIEICIESAKLFYESWNIYQPVRVGITDLPYYIDDKRRPLSQYDTLGPEELPFWLR
ncbi:hypothetical protein ACFO72_003802 [Enterobacter roggenkampii]|uniref:hypothetical protein n=1 Tax=Enterobacter roggenkampii TaxID=1812935 RepID=UPI0003BE39FB|nr:hypothetical protein [Enterobacter roggenkampii]EKU9175651.1 hypothetical protein [Enterobacter roggenkampii MGH 34]EKU9559284.1 hypothetical protein [Enterobacter roggenkampii MGH 34]EKW7742059.1 hypothetical protein [Enterobacter roggenkampii]ELK1822567.1 hypothetical protein [Enterobacter roggenkampii]ELN9572301.1 hypothetical protein [Enterobacter roggenkampii]